MPLAVNVMTVGSVLMFVLVGIGAGALVLRRFSKRAASPDRLRDVFFLSLVLALLVFFVMMIYNAVG